MKNTKSNPSILNPKLRNEGSHFNLEIERVMFLDGETLIEFKGRLIR